MNNNNSWKTKPKSYGPRNILIIIDNERLVLGSVNSYDLRKGKKVHISMK
jgi:hypothetical protein